MLSGAIIRDLHEDPSLREVAVDRLLGDVIHADGGLVIYDGSEEAQCSFEETSANPNVSSVSLSPPVTHGFLGRGQSF